MTHRADKTIRPDRKLGSDRPTRSETETSCAPSELAGLASAFAALGEAKRLEIIAALAGGEVCACDLTGCCGDRQPLLSFHLRRLREAGLVRTRKDGRWLHYALDREALRELGDNLVRVADGEALSECC